METLNREYILNLCNEILTKTENFIEDCNEYDVKYPLQYAKEVYSITNMIMQVI